MENQLAPSILSFEPASCRERVAELMALGADWIHFDVMDGQFVPPITFGDSMVASLRALGQTPFEAHLMTLTPERHFEAFARAGCQRVIFQAETTAHAHRLTRQLKEMGLERGVAINPGTPVAVLEPLLGEIDLALVMTVNPGWGGQEFLPKCLDKVKELRQMAPTLSIEVDGGIEPGTLTLAKEAGANVFVAGSYLVRMPSMATAIQELRKACG